MFKWLTTTKRGFTLVELLIVLVLLGLGSFAVINMFRVTYKSYNKTEERYIKQEQVKTVAEFLQSNAGIAAAINVDIYPTLDCLPEEDAANPGQYIADEGFSYLYTDPADGLLYVLQSGATTPVAISTIPLYINFSVIPGNELFDGEEPFINYNQCGIYCSLNALDSDVTDFTDVDPESIFYTLEVACHFPNMVEKDENRVNLPNYRRNTNSDLMTVTKKTGTVDKNGIAVSFVTDTAIYTDSGSNVVVPPTFTFCLVTAAYGANTPGVGMLCDFRDNVLLKSELGKWVVTKYYQYSPPLAAMISESAVLRFATKAVLAPVLLPAYVTLNPEWLVLALPAVAGLCAAIVNSRRRKKSKA